MTMAVMRHPGSPDPDVSALEGEVTMDVPATVHFEPRPPRAATRVEQDARSVVISEPRGAPSQYDPADVTETVRPRAAARSPAAKSIAWAERHWVTLAIGVTVPLALLLGWSLLP